MRAHYDIILEESQFAFHSGGKTYLHVDVHGRLELLESVGHHSVRVLLDVEDALVLKDNNGCTRHPFKLSDDRHTFIFLVGGVLVRG